MLVFDQFSEFETPVATNPAELLPRLLDQLITLGQMAKQLSHALGNNGHRAETGAELIQKSLKERR
jgi:hypothetical protein